VINSLGLLDPRLCSDRREIIGGHTSKNLIYGQLRRTCVGVIVLDHCDNYTRRSLYQVNRSWAKAIWPMIGNERSWCLNGSSYRFESPQHPGNSLGVEHMGIYMSSCPGSMESDTASDGLAHSYACSLLESRDTCRAISLWSPHEAAPMKRTKTAGYLVSALGGIPYSETTPSTTMNDYEWVFTMNRLDTLYINNISARALFSEKTNPMISLLMDLTMFDRHGQKFIDNEKIKVFGIDRTLDGVHLHYLSEFFNNAEDVYIGGIDCATSLGICRVLGDPTMTLRGV